MNLSLIRVCWLFSAWHLVTASLGGPKDIPRPDGFDVLVHELGQSRLDRKHTRREFLEVRPTEYASDRTGNVAIVYLHGHAQPLQPLAP